MFLIFQNNRNLSITILKIIIFYFSVGLINKQISCKVKNNPNTSLRDIINKLNSFKEFRKPEYIIFSDYFTSKYCSDINAYSVFEYYLKKNYDNVYYIINTESELYKSLEEKNKTKNLILINTTMNIYDELFHYLLNSKILVQSYVLYDFQNIINNYIFSL